MNSETDWASSTVSERNNDTTPTKRPSSGSVKNKN